MTRRSLEGAPHQLVEESLNPSRHLRHHELTVRPDAFDPRLDVEFEVEGERRTQREMPASGPQVRGIRYAEAVPGASQLRTMGFSGTPSQL